MSRKYKVDMELVSAKEAYDKYYAENPLVFRSVDEIEEGSWVTVVSNYTPIKGDGYSDYSITESFGDFYIGESFKVIECSEEYRSVTVYYNKYGTRVDFDIERLRPAMQPEIDAAIAKLEAKRIEDIEGVKKQQAGYLKEYIGKYDLFMEEIRG